MDSLKKTTSKNRVVYTKHRKMNSYQVPVNYLSSESLESLQPRPQISLSLSNSQKKTKKPTIFNKCPANLNTPKVQKTYFSNNSSTRNLGHKTLNQPSKLRKSSKDFNKISMPSIKYELPSIISPKFALMYFKKELTDYEKLEIVEYTDVFFIGKISNKLTPALSGINYGFDDERGDYNLIAGDHIAYRYEIIKMLGKGNFGQVVLCFDHKSREEIALKITRNKKRFNKQALVEIKVLQKINENDVEGCSNVVKLKNFFVFRKHVCMIFDILAMNLFELLHFNKFQGFSLSLIRKFAIQIATCLSFTYKFEIVHCDLKPENVMLVNQSSSKIQVIDFGSSCFESERIYTYIQSRFYRAPEIILGIPYTTAIDVWSFGCILAEFFTGSPIFTGEDEYDQMMLYVEALGIPPEKVREASSRSKLFFDADGSVKFIPEKSKGKVAGKAVVPQSRSVCKILENAPETLVELVTKCFVWDPELRIKPLEIIKHPFFEESPKKGSKKILKNKKIKK